MTHTRTGSSIRRANGDPGAYAARQKQKTLDMIRNGSLNDPAPPQLSKATAYLRAPKRETKTCVVCGKEYEPRAKNQKTCGEKCMKVWRALSQARRRRMESEEK